MYIVFHSLITYLIGVAGSFLPLPSGLVIVGGAFEGDIDEVLAKRQETAGNCRAGEEPRA